MHLHLGIDGGGTGCRAAVADAAGIILGRGQAGPANISSDITGARANIMAAAQAALAEAVGPDRVTVSYDGLSVGMGLAGANAAGITGQLLDGLPFRRVRVETDAVAAVKGALQDRDGIVAALGTGSVFARQDGGTIRQIGGWGLILGDEGSGAWLGRAALSAVLRADEGFDPMTPLAQVLLDELGGAQGVVRFSLTARPADYAALAPRLTPSDDPLAQAVLARGVADVTEAIRVLQGANPVPVTFIGGLGPAYADRLAGIWEVRTALGTALDGALWLARGL
jgi:glucosamine kinase